MKRKFSNYRTNFLLVVLSVTLLFGCKKSELSDENDYFTKSFFTTSKDISPELVAVINDIKRQDDQFHFINTFASKNGIPRWEKTIFNNANKSKYSINGVSQFTTTTNATSENDRNIFFIPLVKQNGSVNAYIVCTKNDNYYSYKVYRRNLLTAAKPDNDNIKKARQAAISLFGLFENIINNKDTIKVGGFYPEVFFDVQLSFGSNNGTVTQETTSGVSVNTTSTAGFITTVCYKFPKPCPGAVQSINDKSNSQTVFVVPSGCYDQVCFQQANMGWTGGGTGGAGGGTGGGGSTGGTTLAPGYTCPPTLWWCESGDFRIVGDQLYTPDNYPYKNEGWPWLWWEKTLTPHEQQIINEIKQEDVESDLKRNLDCKGTNRTGNIKFNGTVEHWLIMLDYLIVNPLTAEVEYAIPGASANLNRGYADIVNRQTGHIFEIKPPSELSTGLIEVDRYVTGANLHCLSTLMGIAPSFSRGSTYSTRVLYAPNRPNEVLEARLSSTTGVIIYEYKPRSTTPLPVVVPQSVTDQLKNLVRKLKEKVTDIDRIIIEYLERNPELANYIKGAAVTAAAAIIIGTIIEDIATLGGGVADDWASFTLAYKIVRVAWKL